MYHKSKQKSVMKKFSLILAALVLFAGISFAGNVKQDKKDDKSKTKKVNHTPVKHPEGKSKTDKSSDKK